MSPAPGASRWVAALHPRPSFLILGAQKAGTTSLHEYLCAHPQVLPARAKEVHYFDNQYGRGENWYLRQFPSRAGLLRRRLRSGGRVISGEATPMYLFHPLAPARIARFMPAARLIVLLRDPVERAYSHYQHNVREGWETLSFEEALAREEERTGPALEALQRNPESLDTRLHAFSYCARGRYLEQLQRYETLFPRERLLVLCSEEFFAAPLASYQVVLDFLGLAPIHPSVGAANQGGYGGVAPEARAAMSRLREAFAAHNERLFAHLGRRLPWR